MTKPVWSHVLALSALKKISHCIRYIIGVLRYKFKSQTNILAYVNTLTCVKAEI